jgi:hypothetical protein
MRLIQFLNNIYTENCIPNEWRSATVIPIFKKDDRKDPQNSRGIKIINACCKI